jgi:hypothetical protein
LQEPGFQLRGVLPRHEAGIKPVQVALKWKKVKQQKKPLLQSRQAAAAEVDLLVRSHP